MTSLASLFLVDMDGLNSSWAGKRQACKAHHFLKIGMEIQVNSEH